MNDNCLPLVSIVVPIYKVEKYLNQCVDSIISQTYKNIEIILVDDGSPDGCGDICDYYSSFDKRVKVIHKENAGVSSARNSGVEVARGEYLYFCDSDDYLNTDAIEKLLNVALAENADVVFFEPTTFQDSIDEIDNFNWSRSRYYKSDTGINQFITLNQNDDYHPCVWAHFYRMKYITENSISFTNNIIHEDDLYLIEVYLHNGFFAHCHERLYNRRVHPNSIMTTQSDIHSEKRYLSALVISKTIDEKKDLLKRDSEFFSIVLRHCIQMTVNFYNNLSDRYKRKYTFTQKLFCVSRLVIYRQYLDNDIKLICAGKLVRKVRRILIKLFHISI